jgi:predicted acyltransferase
LAQITPHGARGFGIGPPALNRYDLDMPDKPIRPVAPPTKPVGQPAKPVTSAPKPARPTAAIPERIVSIDALRGFVMFWLIGGAKVALAAIALLPDSAAQFAQQARHQLEHVPWDGFTAWDLIMPLFLFVVGAAMPFSFSRRLELGQSKGNLYFKIIRRTIILFILGMAVQGHLLDFNLDTLHIYCNTLQAIAAGYFIAGLLLLNVPVWTQSVAAALLMIVYWLLLRFVPVPGRGAGIIEQYANIAYTVDQWVLGRFIDGTKPPYTWVLSSLTFAATVLLGVLGGHLLRSRSAPWLKVILLIVMGAACLATGWAWSEFGGFPIIKHIWTSSMVLWSAGWCYLLLALFYLVVDVIGLRFLAFPFVVIGMNAIVAYVAPYFIPFDGIAGSLFGGLARHLGREGGALLIAVASVTIVWLLLYHLYRNKIFVRI